MKKDENVVVEEQIEVEEKKGFIARGIDWFKRNWKKLLVGAIGGAALFFTGKKILSSKNSNNETYELNTDTEIETNEE